MEELLSFLERFELWIYLLLGGISFVYLQKMVSAWRQWRGTVFGLERDSAQLKLTTSITILVLLALLVIGEFTIVSFVIPAYPRLSSLPTPTLNVLVDRTPTLPVVIIPTAPASTPTRTGLVIAPSESSAEGCVPGRVEWIFPTQGQEIKGTVELKGTVNIPNLGFYKYEFMQPGGKTWTTIAAGNQPKVNGQIGFWNTTQLVPGDYLLRLVAVDNQNQVLPACSVKIRIIPPR
jgi:hypothetical protein